MYDTEGVNCMIQREEDSANQLVGKTQGGEIGGGGIANAEMNKTHK